MSPSDASIPSIPIKSTKRDLEGEVVTVDANGQPLSYVYSDVWDFSQERVISPGCTYRVSFSSTPEGFRRSIQETLMLIYGKNPELAISTLKEIRGHLVVIAGLLGSANWSMIDQDLSYRQFKRELKNKALASGYINNLVGTVNRLHDLGMCSRFIGRSKAFSAKHCCPSKGSVKQAIAIPEIMAQSIFKSAIDIVDQYHPYRHEISKGYDRYFKALSEYKEKNGSSVNFRGSIGNKIEHGIPFDEFRLAGTPECGTEIITACLLVVIGFSGVRISEALSFGIDSYRCRDFGGIQIPTLTGTITKNQEGGMPKQETWVTHPVAKNALELAYGLSQFAREYYRKKYHDKPEILKLLGSSFLSIDIGRQSTKVVSHDIASKFSKFLKSHAIAATINDVNEFDLLNPARSGSLSEGGQLPKLSPHDFRRTFAVFLVRNKLGNLMTLKHQYKHWNVMMSKWYQNHSEVARLLDMSVDHELMEMINEANISVTSDALFEIYNSETLTGGKGERIIQERDNNGYSGTIYVSREEIERQVRNGSVSVVDHPTGYCFKPDCIRICASDRSSKTCQYEAITPAKARSRLPFRERLKERFNALNTGQYYMANILTDMALKIENIEQTLAMHNIDFTPFKAEIINPVTSIDAVEEAR